MRKYFSFVKVDFLDKEYIYPTTLPAAIISNGKIT